MPDEPISLREYLISEIDKLRQVANERDRLYNNQFEDAKNSVLTALIAQKEAVAAAFLASEKAIVKAEEAQKAYNLSHNDLNRKLDDQNKATMPRIEVVGLFKAFDDKLLFMQQNIDSKLEAARLSNEKVYEAFQKDIASLRESRSLLEGKATQTSVTAAQVIAVLGLMIAIAAVVVRFI